MKPGRKNKMLAFLGLGPDGGSRAINPSSISAPAAAYAHARLVAGGPATQWLYTSGVVPIAPDGSVPDGIADQAALIWANIAAILAEADMIVSNVVSVTTYVTPGHDLGPVMAERDKALGGHLAASTLVVVPELAQPEWLMEIAIVAAR